MAEKAAPIEKQITEAIGQITENSSQLTGNIEQLNSHVSLLNQITNMGCCVGILAKNLTDSVLGRDRASTARYTLVIQKTYGYNSGIEIEDSQRMEFATKEAALKYVSKGIPGGYTWHIIDPPNST